MVTKLRLVITSTYFSINWIIYICLMYQTWGCNFYWPCFLYSSSLVFVGVFLLCKNVTFSPKQISLSICIHHHIILFIKSPNIFAHIFIDTPALFQNQRKSALANTCLNKLRFTCMLSFSAAFSFKSFTFSHLQRSFRFHHIHPICRRRWTLCFVWRKIVC